MKTFPFRLGFLFSVSALLWPFTAAAESFSVLLQKAIYAEETEGNVDAAIKLYEQIAAETATNKPLAAQAQYRLAVCYQKKGEKDQAIKLLNELMQQPPADATLAQKAREALASLGEAPSPAISVHRVPLPFSPGWIWRESSDGRFISYESLLPAEDLLVCDRTTGKSWTVFRGIKDKETPANDAIFSPDNRRIAFDTGDDNGGYAIYIANVDGSDRRKLYECDPKKDAISLMGWSADGGRLIVRWVSQAGPKRTRSIATLDAKTAEKKEIARPADQPDRDIWELSADLRYLARRKGEFPRMITVLDLSSNREITIVDKDGGRLIGWTPDSAKLVYTKNAPEGVDVWKVAIQDGQPSSAPEKIWSNFSDQNFPGIGPDGNICYVTRKNKSDPWELWVMEGVLAQKTPASGGSLELAADDILGPDRTTLFDHQIGVGLKMPAGWTIRSAMIVPNSGGRVHTVAFRIPDPGVVASIRYYVSDPWESFGPDFPLINFGPKPNTTEEIDAWLRRFAQTRNEGVAKREAADRDYIFNSDGFVARTINGHRTLAWSGEVRPKSGAPQVEFMAVGLSGKAGAGLWLRGPATQAETLRATFDTLITSLQLQ